MISWLLAAVSSQIILGTSAIFDKAILRKKLLNPAAYTFWLAILGLSAVFLLPFGFQVVSFKIILIGILSGAFVVSGFFFLFKGLNLSEASQALPVIGGISPIFTLIFSYFLLGSRFNLGNFLAFFLLLGGSFVLFLTEEKEVRKASFTFILLSALFLGISTVLSKIVFEQSNFITGFFWVKTGSAILALLSLTFKKFRQEIFVSTRQAPARHGFLYVLNRAYAGGGSILFNFAVSLAAQPALVDALQSLKYVVIFFAAWLILKERFRGKILIGKSIAAILIFLGILFLGIINYAQAIPVNTQRNITWGVTFSTKFSQQLGLDWQQNYEAILKDLKPEKVRLVAYWDDVEKQQNQFDFSQIDWLFEESQKYKTPVILTIGFKTPRWPECYSPGWASQLSTEQKEEALRQYIKQVVGRYKNNSIIEMWQVENEPFLPFGQCPSRGQDFFQKEIATVKSIDPTRPIIATDSGEFGLWYEAVKEGDVFGTTMYRNVYVNAISWLVGNITYPLPPDYFKTKEKIVRLLTGQPDKKFIVIELQAEPWSHTAIQTRTYEDQMKLFSLASFADTIKYAKEAGFDEYYLWGAEWWYYLKEKYNDSRYWDFAKTLFAS